MGDNKKGRMEITMRDHLKDMEYFNEFTPLYNFISKNSVSSIDVSRPQQ